MNVFSSHPDTYNYYPNTTVNLCVISYDGMSAIAGEVSSQTNLQVVWGPVELNSIFDISYSRMYIAANRSTGEHFVVIRGTNAGSLSSILEQDFKVDTSQPVSSLPGQPPGIPATALISQGSFNGVSDLLRMSDHQTGQSALQYLQRARPAALYITGHSLGGTLSPVLFVYLNAMLYGGGPAKNMFLWTFAGITPGGAGFNNYFNSIVDAPFPWRMQNSLDIIPLFFGSEPAMQNIYSAYNLYWNFLEGDLVRGVFKAAAKAGIGYAQPQPGLLMEGDFNVNEQNSWGGQAMVQHHVSPTYQNLVRQYFPLSQAARAVKG